MVDNLKETLMHDIQRFPDRLYIPKNAGSKIGISLSNEIDELIKEKIEISVLETGVGTETTKNPLMTPFADAASNSNFHVISELDNLKSQIKTITIKLDYNLAVLREKEEKNKLLTSILVAKTRDKSNDKSKIEEKCCSCTRGCTVV